MSVLISVVGVLIRNKVRSLPIHVSDVVTVSTGSRRGITGKVIHINTITKKVTLDQLYREGNSKSNNEADQAGPKKKYIPIDPSNLVINKMEIRPSRRKLIERKAAARSVGSNKMQV